MAIGASYAAHGSNTAILIKCWRTRGRCRTLRKHRERMHLRKPEPEVDGWAEAEAALAAAQQMPGGPERVAALKKAGQLRFRADERRRAIRDQERVSKLELDRLIKAQHLLQSSFY
jgi:hypothetical protein